MATIHDVRKERDLLLAALKRLMEEDLPYQCDAESCECGPNGTGFDDDGEPCPHIEAMRAIAAAEGGPGDGGSHEEYRHRTNRPLI